MGKTYSIEINARSERGEMILIIEVEADSERRAIAEAETIARGMIFPGTQLSLNGAREA
jgi:hypothetical protein